MKTPYYTALFVSDTMKFIRNAKKDPAAELQSRPEEHTDRAARLSLKDCLRDLEKACDEQDGAYASALLESYLSRSRSRKELIHTLVFESGKWEGDPHLPRNAMSHHEEILHSTLPLRPLQDDIFRSWTRFVSRWHKRSREWNRLRLYENESSRSPPAAEACHEPAILSHAKSGCQPTRSGLYARTSASKVVVLHLQREFRLLRRVRKRAVEQLLEGHPGGGHTT